MKLADWAKQIGWEAVAEDLWSEAMKAKADRDRLAAELAEVLEYAWHLSDCPAADEAEYPCDCGWTAMREKWRGK